MAEQEKRGLTLSEFVESSAGLFWQPPVKVVLDLQEDLPEIYPPNEFLSIALTDTLVNIDSHTQSTYRKVKTYSEKDRQIVELSWDGKPLSEDEIERINQRYKRGAGFPNLPETCGTLRAGHSLHKCGGSIRIENYLDGIYVARNVLDLPLDLK